MTSREKLEIWEKICIKNSWAAPREMDQWLMKNMVRFSNTGSAIPSESYTVDNKYNTEMLVNAAEGEHLATLILEALSGILTFHSLETEKIFWANIKRRFKEDYKTEVPKIIIPKYLVE